MTHGNTIQNGYYLQDLRILFGGYLNNKYRICNVAGNMRVTRTIIEHKAKFRSVLNVLEYAKLHSTKKI